MRSVEITDQTVEDAVETALRSLGVGRADAEIEILAAPAKGIFRLFGQRHARVRVTVRLSRGEWGRQFVERVARTIVSDVHVAVHEGRDTIRVDIKGGELGLLIGRHGHTLNALQDLVTAGAARHGADRRPIVVDVEGYRERRAEIIEREARRAAQRVQRDRRSVALAPMTASERKQVHIILQGDEAVRTESVGREPFRRVIVLPIEDGIVKSGRGRRSGRRPRGSGHGRRQQGE